MFGGNEINEYSMVYFESLLNWVFEVFNGVFMWNIM